MSDEYYDLLDEIEEELMVEREIKGELTRYDEECGEVVSYNRGYCPVPNYGDWRDKQYGIRIWSKEVRNRDGHKCRRISCGSTNNLHAHHILNQADNPNLRFEVWNGITLCQPCHMLFHKIYGKVENTEKQIEEFITGGGEDFDC